MQALGLRRLHQFWPQWLLALMITNQLGRLSGELNEVSGLVIMIKCDQYGVDNHVRDHQT